MYEVQSTMYQVGNTRYLPAVGRRSTELRKYQETRSKRQETRNKRQEARGKSRETRSKRREAGSKKQETRSKRLDPFAVRFLCVSAPLREKKRNRPKFKAYQYGLFYILQRWKISLFRQENIDLQILRVSWGSSTSRPPFRMQSKTSTLPRHFFFVVLEE